MEDLVVITGFSGAGKSTAMNVFEDAGYFCVDNLPPEMIRHLVDLFHHEGSKVQRAAVVCDVRGGAYFEGLVEVLEDITADRLVFLDAEDDVLMTRYKETRRRHPLAPNGSVSAGIAAERAALGPLRSRADIVIDTTGLNAAALRRRIAKEVLPKPLGQRLAVTFMSFGHKHGPVRDADLVFDVRFLPNPHYVDGLRPLTGHDQGVVDYIAADGQLDAFLERLLPLLDFLLPQFMSEGKAHLTVAVGCTGGRHRSVAVVEHLVSRYAATDGMSVAAVHRDTHLTPDEAYKP